MRKIRRVVGLFLVAVMFSSLSISVSAGEISDHGFSGTRATDPPSFWDWYLADLPDVWYDRVVSPIMDAVDDHVHHYEVVGFGSGVDGYSRVERCPLCGHEIRTSASQVRESYDDYVSDLPTLGYSSDGHLVFIPDPSECYNVSANVTYIAPEFGESGVVINDYGVITFGSSKPSGTHGTQTAVLTGRIFFNPGSLDIEGYSRLLDASGKTLSEYDIGISRSPTVSFSVSAPFLSERNASYSLAKSGYWRKLRSNTTWSYNSEYNYLSFSFSQPWHFFGSSTIPEPKDGQSFGGEYSLPWFYVNGVDLLTDSDDLGIGSDTYAPSSRAGAIRGDYVVNNSGNLTIVENQYIINEGDNTFINPITNVTFDLGDFIYNYDDRSYDFTFRLPDSGDGDGSDVDYSGSITYGDVNISLTIEEDDGDGGVVVNNYIIDYAVPDGQGQFAGLSQYRVYHYLLDDDGNCELYHTETKFAYAGDVVAADILDIDGYSVSRALGNVRGSVASDGSTALAVFYVADGTDYHDFFPTIVASAYEGPIEDISSDYAAFAWDNSLWWDIDFLHASIGGGYVSPYLDQPAGVDVSEFYNGYHHLTTDIVESFASTDSNSLVSLGAVRELPLSALIPTGGQFLTVYDGFAFRYTVTYDYDIPPDTHEHNWELIGFGSDSFGDFRSYRCSVCGEYRRVYLSDDVSEPAETPTTGSSYDGPSLGWWENFKAWLGEKLDAILSAISFSGGESSSGSDDDEDSDPLTLFGRLGELVGALVSQALKFIGSFFSAVLGFLGSLVSLISDRFTQAIETILGFFETIPAYFSGFLALLGLIFPLIPDELSLLFVFAAAAVVVVGIVRALRR